MESRLVGVDGVDSESLVLRVGRQEMYYGSQRLVSVRETPNIRLSFDGARLVYQAASMNLSAFAVKPVSIQEGYFNNEPNPDSTFWGLYGVTPVTWGDWGPPGLLLPGIPERFLGLQPGNRLGTKTLAGTATLGRTGGLGLQFRRGLPIGAIR